MKSKLKEEKRQLLRKENEKTSRFLDNYYNPNIHKKIWEPSGSFNLNQKIFIYMEIVVFHIILEAPHYLKKKIRNKFIF